MAMMAARHCATDNWAGTDPGRSYGGRPPSICCWPAVSVVIGSLQILQPRSCGTAAAWARAGTANPVFGSFQKSARTARIPLENESRVMLLATHAG